MQTVLEFFAGGGMAHAGLTDGWRVTYANDIDPAKGTSYTANWPSVDFDHRDINEVRTQDLPNAELAWASFPCQDLSLAGLGGGLSAQRSGTYWAFYRLIRELADADRRPPVVVLENVCGLLSARGGQDFGLLCDSMQNLGYRVGALVIDTSEFLPQSRPRLFVVCVDNIFDLPRAVSANGPTHPWHPKALTQALTIMSAAARDDWHWWNLPAPKPRRVNFTDCLLNDQDTSLNWHPEDRTEALLDKMSQTQRAAVERIRQSRGRTAGTIYLRTRSDEHGNKVQRAEARFDGLAGCLRTAAGGSSRQIVIVIDDGVVRTRLLAPREGARLMGLPDSYILPSSYYDAFKLLGDGVAVPAVRHLFEHLIDPIIRHQENSTADLRDAA